MAMTPAVGLHCRLDDVLAAFEAAWRSGERPRSEDWLGRLDPGRPDEASELIYAEFCLAETGGLDPAPEAFLARFPEHGDSLSRLFELHSLTSTADWSTLEPPVELPEQGDEIGPYRLVRKLGEGSFARVFLAEQADLSRRHVVVKVSTRPSPEPRLLARASHAHIVEVLKHTTADDDALQVVCMPFLGGETLAAVNGVTGPRPRSGRALLARLDDVSAPEYPRAEVPRPAREILGRLSYPKAVAWIFARLAEALDHAHRKGVAHGDIKPSNILLTADALPMLFDFNLAVDWHDDDTTLGGGTLAYMSPERLLALAAARADDLAPVDSADRHRADVYALVLVLVETLTGVAPEVPSPRDGSRETRAVARAIAEARAGGTTAFPGWKKLKIPAGLRPILAHSLAADPSRRHVDGRALAEDLDRWRSDLAPRSAPDARWPIPLARRLRRNRLTLAAATLTLAGAIAAGAYTSIEFRGTLRVQAEEKYARFLDKGDHGLFGFRQFGAGRLSPGGDPAEAAMRKLRHYNVFEDASWRLRDDVSALSKTNRDDLELLMLEQVYRLAKAWSERSDSEADWNRAHKLLDRECRAMPCLPLLDLRRRLGERLGIANAAPDPKVAAPPAWVEKYMQGVAVEERYARRAYAHYDRVVTLRPDLLWPRYRAMAAGFRLGQYIDAEILLRPAIEQRPENPALLTNLAAALIWLRRPAEAVDACERALVIDPEYVQALQHLAFIDGKFARHDPTDRYATLTSYRGRGESDRLGLQRLFYARTWFPDGEHAPLADPIRKVLAADPTNPDARVAEAIYLGSVKRMNDAVAVLNSVLGEYPDHLHARYCRAYYLRELGQPEAVAEYAAILDDPRFEELFRIDPFKIRVYRSVTDDLLKEGRIDRALEIAERGITASTLRHILMDELYYNLGRVHAALARDDPSWLEEARDDLRRAIAMTPNLYDLYLRDPIFEAIRKADPGFLKPPERHARADATPP